MPRTTKPPEERRLEIIETAERLFRTVGYASCSVETIIREMGVAKGTFYYYFRSKEEVLGAVVDRALDRLTEMAAEVADDPSQSAMHKMQALLSDSHVGGDDTEQLAEMMHLPENRQLHEATNVQTVLRLSPIFARIIEQGNGEGVFAVARPLETIQFLLTGAQFLTDGGLFSFSAEEIAARRLVTQEIVEKSLGAEPGSFSFMNPARGDGTAEADPHTKVPGA